MSRKEYFAYGSNLNFEQMAYRCPEATAVGIAKLDGYELAFRRGYLTILPKEGASVEGLIWSVTNDLISYIKQGQQSEEGAWETNIFGKSVGELMEDGIRNKIAMMDDECQMKLQDTMQKIVNDNTGGMVCIII